MKKSIIVAVLLLSLCLSVLCACGTKTDPLKSQKDSAIAEINTLVVSKVNSNKYSESDVRLIYEYRSNARTEIYDAADTATIDRIKKDAFDKINALLTIEEETALRLKAEAKEIAKQNMGFALEHFVEEDYSSENWQAIMSLFNEKCAIIDVADEITDDFILEHSQALTNGALFVDKLSDKYATAHVDIDGTEKTYVVRFRNDEYDIRYSQNPDVDSIHDRIITPPQKDGYLFTGWYNSFSQPYDFSIIFSTSTPQQHYYLTAKWKEIPSSPVSGIEDIIGTWTGKYSPGTLTVAAVRYKFLTTANITVNKYGLITISLEKTIMDVDDELAELFFEYGYYEKHMSLTLLCEYNETDDDIVRYNLYYFDIDNSYPPRSTQHYILFDSIKQVLKYNGHELTTIVD